MQCQICKKAGMSGNNVSHSNRRTKTRFKANVHKQTLFQDGKAVKVKICSRCLRSVNKSRKVRQAVGSL
jgi:large subunit ribosomal protein L28